MKPADLAVRPATLDDLEVIVAFNAAMALETEGKSLNPDILRSGVRTVLVDESRGLYLVAETGGLVVGQTMITREWSDWRNGDFWWIQSVYVHRDYRRRGVFRALHEYVRTLARATQGVCGLRLYAHRSNGRALQTYASLGMKTTDYLVCEEDWSSSG